MPFTKGDSPFSQFPSLQDPLLRIGVPREGENLGTAAIRAALIAADPIGSAADAAMQQMGVNPWLSAGIQLLLPGFSGDIKAAGKITQEVAEQAGRRGLPLSRQASSYTTRGGRNVATRMSRELAERTRLVSTTAAKYAPDDAVAEFVIVDHADNVVGRVSSYLENGDIHADVYTLHENAPPLSLAEYRASIAADDASMAAGEVVPASIMERGQSFNFDDKNRAMPAHAIRQLARDIDQFYMDTFGVNAEYVYGFRNSGSHTGRAAATKVPTDVSDANMARLGTPGDMRGEIAELQEELVKLEEYRAQLLDEINAYGGPEWATNQMYDLQQLDNDFAEIEDRIDDLRDMSVHMTASKKRVKPGTGAFPTEILRRKNPDAKQIGSLEPMDVTPEAVSGWSRRLEQPDMFEPKVRTGPPETKAAQMQYLQVLQRLMSQFNR